MSSDPEQAYIIDMLELMGRSAPLPPVTIPGSGDESNSEVGSTFNEAKRKYLEAREAADRLDADDKERKEFEKAQEAFAKAIPGITKGTIGAIKAFQGGDSITGSAAVMEVCASVASLVGSVSSIGGPPGMLIGAIFSMIGQILGAFAPQSKSLADKIQDLLENLEAEEKARNIRVVHTDVTNQARTLRYDIQRMQADLRKTVAMQKALEARLSTPTTGKTIAENAPGNLCSEVARQAQRTSVVVDGFKCIDSPTMNKYWGVAEWLEEERFERHKDWPKVLAGTCRAYNDLIMTFTMLYALGSVIDEIEAIWQGIDKIDPLPKTPKKDLHNALVALRSKKDGRLDQFFQGTVPSALNHFRKLEAAGRKRAMVWHCGSPNGELYGGPNLVGDFTKLRGQGKRLAVSVSRSDMESATPNYHIFHLEYSSSNGRTYHGVWKHPYEEALEEWREFTSLPRGLTDIWATPGAGSDADEIYLYVAEKENIVGYVLDKNNNLRHGNYSPALRATAQTVRVVHKPNWLMADPDAGENGASLKDVQHITYGGLNSSPDIYLDASGVDGYIASPWTHYDGMGIDQYYLWVFVTGGFACATHASVVGAFKNKREPRWMKHMIPDDLLYTPYYLQFEKKINRRWGSPDPRPPLRGLADLCSCDDGTLVAAIRRRSVVEEEGVRGPRPIHRSFVDGRPIDYSFVDGIEGSLYNGVYHTDLKGGTPKITVTWSKLRSAEGSGVQKLPVPSWAMLEGLTTSLSKLEPVVGRV